jgi:hypothetical protein
MTQVAHSSAGKDTKTLLDSVAELQSAYSSDRLGGYQALRLKDSHTEETTCNMQWGPMMRT